MPRVVHLCTHDLAGGAARSAWRLHEGMRAVGADSRMVVRTKHSNSEWVSETDDGTVARWHDQIVTPWLRSKLPPGAPWYSSSFSSVDLTEHPWIREADVFHLHWVAQWLDPSSVDRLAKLGKPLFWTFHDLRAVTGGNHYPGNNSPPDDSWQDGSDLEGDLAAITSSAFEEAMRVQSDLPISVISPSRWLADQSRGSRIGRNWKVEVIPYGIDVGIFCPGDRSAARRRRNLPEEAICLLFGCGFLGEERKGFSLLKKSLALAMEDPAFDRLVQDGKVRLVLFGQPGPTLEDIPLPIHDLGSIGSDAELAEIYRASDAYLCPTLEDNLPNTVMESLACGVPVLGFETGGVPDMVEENRNGALVPCGDWRELAALLRRFSLDGAFRESIQSGAGQADKEIYDYRLQGRRVLKHYAMDEDSAETIPAESAEPPRWIAPVKIDSASRPWLLKAVAEEFAKSETNRGRHSSGELVESRRQAKALKKEIEALARKLAKTEEKVLEVRKRVDAWNRRGWFHRAFHRLRLK